MRSIWPVVEVADAARGLIELKVKDSRGARIGFFQIASSDMDDELLDALKDWQARHSHEGGSLSLMPVSSSSA